MAASITLAASIDFYEEGEGDPVDPAHWELSLTVTSSSDTTTQVFLLEKKRYRVGDDDKAWGDATFVRVASRRELALYPFEDPEDDDPDYLSHKNGYHQYLSDTTAQRYNTWDEANQAYARTKGQIRALLDATVDTTVTGALALSVVGPVPTRALGVLRSVYPMDQVHFTGTGGRRPYTYSLRGNISGTSGINANTGLFQAAFTEDSTVTVVVTDSDTAEATLLVTLVMPDSPSAVEVLSV